MSDFLEAELAEAVRKGMCPKCGCYRLLGGPGHRLLDGSGCLSRNMLCVICLREYNVGPIAVELLSECCLPERLAEVYGLPGHEEQPGHKEWPYAVVDWGHSGEKQ